MRIAIIIILILGLGGGAVGLYLWNKPSSDMAGEKADVTITATELMNQYSSDEASANTQFLGKVIEVSGIVSDIVINDDGTSAVSLESGSMMGAVMCNMSKNASASLDLAKGQQVVIKGKCSGYLMDVILERAVIESK